MTCMTSGIACNAPGCCGRRREGVEAGIPSLLDSVVRAAGPPADAAYRAGFAIGREWAEWSASFAGPEQP